MFNQKRIKNLLKKNRMLNDDYEPSYTVKFLIQKAESSTSIDISPYILTEEDYACLFKNISEYKIIKKIDIKNKIITAACIEELSTYMLLQTNNNLECLDFSYSIFNIGSFRILCDALSSNLTLKSLILQSCIFDCNKELIDSLHDMLIKNTTIKHINLYRVFSEKTDRYTMNKMCDIIKNTHLNRIDFKDAFHKSMQLSSLNEEFHLQILESMRFNRHITHFNMGFFVFKVSFLQKINDILTEDNNTLLNVFNNNNTQDMHQSWQTLHLISTIRHKLKRNYENNKRRKVTLFQLLSPFIHTIYDDYDDLRSQMKKMRIK